MARTATKTGSARKSLSDFITERLLAGYLGITEAAIGLLYPHVPRMPRIPSAALPWSRPADPPATQAAAIDLLDTELPNLVAAVRAGAPGLLRYSWLLVDALRGYVIARGRCAEGLAMGRLALAAAQQEGDTPAEASMTDVLGLIHYNLSDYAKAAGLHSRALVLNRRSGNPLGEAAALHNLGRVHSQLGKPTQASLYHEQSLTINRRLGNRHGEASDLNYVGAAWLSRGRPDRAIAYQTQALAISREIAGLSLELLACNGLGLAHWALGELDRAVRFQVDCLALCGQLGHKVGETNALVCLAETNCDAGRYQEAYAQAQTCVASSASGATRSADSMCWPPCTCAAVRPRSPAACTPTRCRSPGRSGSATARRPSSSDSPVRCAAPGGWPMRCPTAETHSPCSVTPECGCSRGGR